MTATTESTYNDVDQLLALLDPSQPDESKFVAILVLPRLLKKDEASVEHVFNGMNFKFIERLLRTSASEDAQVPEDVLREIAVNILACFAHYETLATRPPMVDKIPALSIALTPNDPSPVTKEVLHILLCVAIEKQGLVRMLDSDVLRNVLEVFVDTTQEEERRLCVQLIKSVYGHACHLLHKEHIPSLASAFAYSLSTLVTALSKVLDLDQAALKFAALDILATVLPDIPMPVVEKFKKMHSEHEWLAPIKNGLRQVVTNKVGDFLRDKATLVIACLLRYFGPQWLFGSLQQTKDVQRRKEKGKIDPLEYAQANFPALFIHLVSVEARVMADKINDDRHSKHNHNAISGKEANDKAAKEHARQMRMLPPLFEILESAIEYLATSFTEEEEEEKESTMDPDMLLHLRTSLSETMDVVMELLQFLQSTRSVEELQEDLIVQTSIRLVALWLAEEGYEVPE
ncbi:Neurochondrin-domain-containing protein [Spinellus fusiger]|nr:Neurochondrin-domain-containing protein [Spinellus fusiger]